MSLVTGTAALALHPRVLGCDWSKFQDVVDVRGLVRATNDNEHPVRFSIVKATDGLGSVDSCFERNFRALRPGGMRWGSAYHWFKPRLDPEKQALRFVEVVGNAGYDRLRDLPLFADFEVSDGLFEMDLLEPLLVFLRTVSRKLRKRAGVYCGKWFFRENRIPDCEEITRYFLWHAQYPGTHREGTQYEKAIADLARTTPDLPDAWVRRGLAEHLWQFDGGDGNKNKGLTLPGGRDSDFNFFNGTEDDVDRMIASSLWPDEEEVETPRDGSALILETARDIGWRPASRDSVLEAMFPGYLSTLPPPPR